MFKNLFSRDLPAAKAYHAAKLNAVGNEQFAASLMEYAPHKTADELNAAIDRYAVAIGAKLAASPTDQRGLKAGRIATSTR
jgi:hypothetical protein